MIASTDSASAQAEGQPRLWHRLSVRLAGLFAAVTLLAVGAVGLFTYERHQEEVQDTVGTQLLNIARVAALLVDPALHAEVQQTLAPTSDAYRQLQKRLVAVQNEVLLTTPIYTLADYDPAGHQARIIVISDGPGKPGDQLPLAPEVLDPLRWTFEDGVARYPHIYQSARGTRITAFAPIVGRAGRPIAVVSVDYPVEIYAQAALREDPDAAREISVSLPIRCSIIEGKIVRPEPVAGLVLRLGRHEAVARLDTALSPLTNVRFRLAYPDQAGESQDIYGKVVKDERPGAGLLTRIHFTSVTDADALAIEALVGRRD